MYKFQTEHQISFMDFNQFCGMQLAPSNEWDRIADPHPVRCDGTALRGILPVPHWAPFRMAFAELFIQKRKNLSDRNLVREITEPPYLQYFLGLHAFQREKPFRDTALVGFRKRLGYEFMVEADEILLRTLGKKMNPARTNGKKLRTKVGTKEPLS